MNTGPQPVSDQMRAFALEYASCFNASKAGAAVGIASSTALNWLKDPRVVALVREHKRIATERNGVSVDMVLRTLQTILDGDIGDYYDENGRLKRFDEMTPEQRMAIKSMKPTKEGIVLELHDKLAAVEKAGKWLGMFTDKVEISGPGGRALPINLGMTLQEAAEAYQKTLRNES